ncbi:TetR/AcrR family transcriptional regulator [Dietzia natronolimnaea]|uniref:TetR/AcrR family transcriptional regulator n=1 Tax=Dietzia natronolimnaea TaxID=161920 RepID=UPI0015FD22F3|nr:TetR family transcriptional regulator [Dietzia natronolimnaea]MBB1037700.1 TetR/AcrR family transcriptional regulator [Dietzia natronolimnaea]
MSHDDPARSGAERRSADRSGVDRILDAAILKFGAHGVTGTSLKAIAAEAGVSQALILHHFGSKDRLHRACDEHVVRLVRQGKESAMGQGPQLDPLQSLRQIEDSRPLLRYLARTLSEGGDHIAHLIDEMVADAEAYTGAAVEAGLIKPSAHPRERVVVLTLWSLGSLVLHEHMNRLLGVDFLDTEAPPENLAPYMLPVVELFTQGLFEPGTIDRFADAFDTPDDPRKEQ